jgi:RHS repeat-associated protein
MDRLETATAPGLWGTAVYQHDALGNRTLKSDSSVTTSVTFDADNRIESATGNEAFSAMTFTWDPAGHLASSSDGTTYLYDGHGRRVQKADAAQTIVYHYDAAGRVIAETLRDGTKVREYFYLANKLLAVDGCITGAPPGCSSERQWYHTDTLGSVLARTDLSGAVVANLDYQPWGEQWSPPAAAGDRQYNGRVYDPGTGFHDYGARMYWPEIGRFISADTYAGDIANPASLNRYSYVWNNPYKYVDPNGRNPVLMNLGQRFMQWCQSGGCQAAGNAALAAAAAVAAWAGIEIAKDAAKSDATLLPDSAWDKKAPHPQNAKNKYGPPGETIDWERYNPDTGELEKSKVTYDEFGRQKVRTDYTDHGDPDAHENPHHENTEYGPGRTDGEKSGPKPGPGKGHPETLKPSGG